MSKKKLVPHWRWILLSGAGAAILAAAVALPLFFVASQPLDLAAVVPTNQTVALFRHITRQDEQTFAPWFPILTQVPIEKEADVALLTDAQKNVEWIVDEPGTTRKNLRIDRFTVIASSQNVTAILSQPSEVLTMSKPYKTLVSGTDPQDFQAFVRLPSPLPSSSGWMGMLLSLRASPSYGLLTRNANAASLRLYSDHEVNPGEAAIPSLITTPPSHASLIMQTGAPAALLQQYLSSLPRDQAVLERALWEKQIGDSFEQGLSADYELLPLLQGNTTAIIQTGSGALPGLMVTGRMDNADQLSSILTRLRAQMRAKLGKSMVLRRTFENQPANIVESDTSHIEEQQGALGNWQLRATLERTGSGGLWTAQRGSDYILSTRKDWLEGFLQNPQQVPLPGAPGTMIAGGIVDRATAMSHLPASPSLIDLPLRELLGQPTQTILWSVGQETNVTSVSLQRE